MKYLVSGFLDVLNEILTNIMGIFTGPFWKELGITVGTNKYSMLTVGGKFDEWLPGVQYLERTFIIVGWFFVMLLFFAGIMKAFLPDGVSESAEHPFTVIGRTIAAAFCVAWAFQIMYFLQAPMAGIFDGIYQLQSHKTLAMGFESDAWGDFSHPKMKKAADEEIFATLGGYALCIIMSFAVMWLYIKLVLEMVERYVTTCFLFYVSPLAFSTIASKSTNGIAANFIRMLFAQYLLIMFNCIFLFVFCFAYTRMSDVKFSGVSEVVIFFAAMMAWLKLGARLDEHMNTLGLGAARTGAGLGGELMAAAGLAYGSMKLGASAIRNGAGFGKGVTTGKASDKSVGGRLGNKVNTTIPPAAKDKAKDAAHSAFTKAADAMHLPSGLKGEAHGVMGNKTIADAAMSPRISTGDAARKAANQGLTLSDGSSPSFSSGQVGNGHITGMDGGKSYDFVPTDGKAVSGPAILASGPDGKDWAASLKGADGAVDASLLQTDFAHQALNTDGVNAAIGQKLGSEAQFYSPNAGVHQGFTGEDMPVTYANADIFQKDANFTRSEMIEGKQFWVADGHYEPTFKQ